MTGIYDAAALVTGASVLAADLVVDGKADVAFNPSGGWHHAHPAARRRILRLQRSRGGHRPGPRARARRRGWPTSTSTPTMATACRRCSIDRADVLTISLHEGPRFLFPGTGEVAEIGEGEGVGYSVNFRFAPFTTDEIYLWALREAVLPFSTPTNRTSS